MLLEIESYFIANSLILIAIMLAFGLNLEIILAIPPYSVKTIMQLVLTSKLI